MSTYFHLKYILRRVLIYRLPAVTAVHIVYVHLARYELSTWSAYLLSNRCLHNTSRSTSKYRHEFTWTVHTISEPWHFMVQYLMHSNSWWCSCCSTKCRRCRQPWIGRRKRLPRYVFTNYQPFCSTVERNTLEHTNSNKRNNEVKFLK